MNQRWRHAEPASQMIASMTPALIQVLVLTVSMHAMGNTSINPNQSVKPKMIHNLGARNVNN